MPRRAALSLGSTSSAAHDAVSSRLDDHLEKMLLQNGERFGDVCSEYNGSAACDTQFQVLTSLSADEGDDQGLLTADLIDAIWGTSKSTESESALPTLDGPTLRDGIERRLNIFVNKRAEEIAQCSPNRKQRTQRLEEEVTAYIEDMMAQCTERQRRAIGRAEQQVLQLFQRVRFAGLR